MTAATDPFDGLALARLTAGDAARGAALSEEIGWNQNRADWRYMLANGFGYGRTDAAGRLVGSAMALGYGGFAWVCMVLVSPAWRRRGIATELTNRVLADLERAGTVAGLDATPDGREVYRHLGFEDIYRIERRWASSVAPAAAPVAEVAPAGASDLPAIAALDARAFGGDRRALLASLMARLPGRAFVARDEDRVAGYALARDGRQATQIGPLVADDTEVAIALAARALAGVDGQAVIDCPDRHGALIGWLGASGFAYQRPYIRMLRGRSRPLDDADMVYALAGPELG
ncbi:MAG: GNAT family N-acetyltransferase [Defluviicoccus sp.]|nr:GNAT family N-acetyltransferase [Defluviicoccus sp.]MDE0383675.1 GNAT family N-acetyltransferase [Defluviicoccus sp.]